MPVTGNLAALMKKWPLNNVILSAATHSKLREAWDGTETQVATCTIDRWTAKMKGAKEYITKEILGRKGRLGGTRESSKWCSIGIGKEELILGRGLRTDFDPSQTTLLTILLLNDPALPLTKSSQRPSSSARLSAKLIVLGLLDLGSFTSTVKDTPPKLGPYKYYKILNL